MAEEAHKDISDLYPNMSDEESAILSWTKNMATC
jgi:hypothetical protein